MRITHRRTLATAVAAVLSTTLSTTHLSAQPAPNPAPVSTQDLSALDPQLALVRQWKLGGDRKLIDQVAQLVARAERDPKAQADVAARLAAALSADATVEGKEFFFRQLRSVATAKEVPAVAKYLTDKQWAHMARYVLEAVKDPAAADALRDAMSQTSGTELVGLINSLGAKRDVKSVSKLHDLLKERKTDAAVFAAAASALGQIGTADADRALASAQPATPQLQRALSDARLRVADAHLKEGKKMDAAEIYADLRTEKSSPSVVKLAALRGLAEADAKKATPSVLDALKSDDAGTVAVAAELSRQLPGPDVTKQLVALLPSLKFDAQALLIESLGRRGDPGARSAVLNAASSQDATVRTAALTALGALGDAQSIPTLTKALTATPAERDAARASLGSIKGDGIDPAILARVQSSDPPELRAELIKVLARRTKSVVPPLLDVAAKDDSEPVRVAAVGAVGQLASKEHLPALLDRIVRGKSEPERNAARDALASAANRLAQRDGVARQLVAALKEAPTPVKVTLLSTLSRVGGPTSLSAVRDAMSDGNADVKKAATRALTDWQDLSALDDLTRLARSDDKTDKVLALRAVVRLMNQANDRPTKDTLAVYQQLLDGAGPDEKKLILNGVGDVKDAAAYDLALPHLTDPAVRNEAAAAVLKIANNQRNHRRTGEAVQAVLGSEVSPNQKQRAEQFLAEQRRR